MGTYSSNEIKELFRGIYMGRFLRKPEDTTPRQGLRAAR
jgi:hypothetical protein